MLSLLGLLVVAAITLQTESLGAQSVSKDLCLSCHGVAGLEKERQGKKVALYVDREKFSQSVHASFECTACHADISQVPHQSELAPVQCASCHAEVATAYGEGVHGQARANGKGDAARCSDCHGSHDILRSKNPDALVYPLNLPRTCGTCHGDAELAKRHGIPVVNAYQLYMDSIHGRALTKSGLLVSANCYSCHGSHRILPAADPKSSCSQEQCPGDLWPVSCWRLEDLGR